MNSLKQNAMMEEAIASAEISMNTPDTEWSEDFFEYFKGNIDGESKLHCNTKYVREFIQHLLTSSDTYWKEKMKRAVKKKQKQVSGEKRLNAGLPNTQVFLDGYNHALNDTITLIERI